MKIHQKLMNLAKCKIYTHGEKVEHINEKILLLNFMEIISSKIHLEFLRTHLDINI